MRYRYSWSLAFLLFVVALAGCGDSDSFVNTGGGGAGGTAQTATILVSQVLARAVPETITSQRFTGLGSQGQVLYGPLTRDKAVTISLTEVPIAVVRLRIEYLAGGQVVGIGTTPVSLTAGQILVIDDPDFEDVVTDLVSLQVTPGGSTIASNSEQAFEAVGTYEDGTQLTLTTSVSWTSSTPAVATIDESGLASAVAAGQTTITATLGDVSDSTTLTVSSATITSIAITPANPVLAPGTTQQLTATATLSDSTTQDVSESAVWISGSPLVAQVQSVSDGSPGLVSTVAAGQATITATAGGVSAQTTVTVTSATVTSVSITPDGTTIGDGTTTQFALTANYSDATTQTVTDSAAWTSGTPSVATIESVGDNDPGLAHALDGGQTTITASFGGRSDSVTLTVTPATVVSIAVSPPSPSVDDGLTQQFSAMATLSDGGMANVTSTASWTSGTTSVATIESSGDSNPGLAHAVDPGSSTITASVGAVSGQASLTVTAPTLVSITVTSGSNLDARQTRQMTAMGNYSNSTSVDLTNSVTWVSSATSILTVSSSGLVKALIAGSSTVSATMGAVTGQVTLAVNALSGTFANAGNLSTGTNTTPRDVDLGDLNGDNIPDLVNTCRFAMDPGPDIQVWLGVGDGTFTGPTAIDLPGTDYQGCRLINYDGDSDLDLVVTQQPQDKILLIPGTGAGSFTAASAVTINTPAGSSPNRIVAGNFNGGAVDLAVSLSGTNQVAILLGNGTGFDAPAYFTTGGIPWALATADLDGDTVLDIVTACVNDGTAVFHKGAGNGTFGAGTDVAADNTIPACDGVCIADFDGDAENDLGLVGQGSDGRVFLGNGNGTFTSGATISGINGQSGFWVTAGDLDCDGAQDLVFGLINGTAGIRFALGNGDGTFQSPVTMATGTNASVVVIGSVNTSQDDRPDIIVDNQGDSISILLQQ